MDPTLVLILIVFFLPLFWKPTRKAVGLLNIIVGTVLTLTGIGAVIGIPMILIGGICLFIGNWYIPGKWINSMPSLGEWKSSYISGWRKAFDYKSKSSRLDFISFELVFIIIYTSLSILKHALNTSVDALFASYFASSADTISIVVSLLQIFAQTIQIISFFFIAGFFVSSISLTVRRLRDIGKRWWWVFWFYIPIISFFFTVWLFITPSKEIHQ